MVQNEAAGVLVDDAGVACEQWGYRDSLCGMSINGYRLSPRSAMPRSVETIAQEEETFGGRIVLPQLSDESVIVAPQVSTVTPLAGGN